MKPKKKKPAKTKTRAKAKAKKSPKRRPAVRKRAVARQKSARRPRPRKAASRKRATKRAAAPRKKARAVAAVRGSSERPRALPDESWRRGLGAESGGQSGDVEGISRSEIADSESVEELLEEGQSYEAEVVSGVENAPDADEAEVTTREVPEDDVPEEYLDKD
ncbi:MAG TPA: hypothetical protein VMN82_10605 [Thermoanaerobaculia bacterium]|nr:hypothetical protein [Thermoanaerobaculia bacterium]